MINKLINEYLIFTSTAKCEVLKEKQKTNYNCDQSQRSFCRKFIQITGRIYYVRYIFAILFFKSKKEHI